MFTRVLEEKLDAALKLSDERHDRTMEVLNDILRSLKDLRETQIAKKNGNGNGAARAAAAKAKQAAPPVGYAGLGAGIAELIRYLASG